MTILINEVLVGVNRNSGYVYYLKEHLKAAGWTVVSSRVGSGTSTASDLIAGPTTMTSQYSYIVLQSPHFNASDRIHIMLANDNVGNATTDITYAPGADLTGLPAAPAFPTGTATTLIANDAAVGSASYRLHLLADTNFPYGWAAAGTLTGDGQTAYGVMACVPLDQQPANPGKPYWIFSSLSAGFTATEICTQDNAAKGGFAQPYPPGSTPVSTPGLRFLDNDAVQAIPNNTTQDNAGVDVAIPVTFTRYTGKYVGASTFMRWNGTTRPNLTTFNDYGRIVFQDVNFPWDGATQPVVI